MQKVMESLYKSKMAKQKSPNGNVSPVLMKYLSSNTSNRGQMSAVDEEDVLVMDGLPIMRLSPSPSSSPSHIKTELCQFAHGKEELRPNRFQTIKSKYEICKSFITGSCIHGSKCRFMHQVMTDSALVLANQMEDHPISKPPITPFTFKSQVTNTSGKAEQTGKTTTLITKPAQSGATSTISNDYWSPQDDGIEVTLPSHHGQPPPREKVDKCIDSILYCPSTAARMRLLVFAEICPEY